MRVVVDTNILVSFAIRPNADFERMFDYLAATGICLASDETIAELLEVLSREKFRKYVPLEQTLEYVEWYAETAELIAVTEHVTACRDPKDDKFLSLAVAGKADAIIAGDNHLLEMGTFRGIPIYRATRFVGLFVA